MIGLSAVKLRLRSRHPALYRLLKAPVFLLPYHRRRETEFQQRVQTASLVDERIRELLGSEEVQSGPLSGLKLDGRSVWSTDYSARLLGTYEKELHDPLSRAVLSQPPVVVDVGCADGYYAVGLARTCPRAQILAFDTDREAREATARLAVSNGVADRVEVRGLCSESDLCGLPDGSLVIVDCEGAELELLSDAVASDNPNTTFIVECHDFLDPTISSALVRRFAGRKLTRYAVQPRSAQDAPAVSSDLVDFALDEKRSMISSWLVVE